MKKILFLLLLPFFILFAENLSVGSVVDFKGSVKVKHEGSIRKTKVKKNQAIKAGDLILTGKNSSLEIVLSDKSSLILDQLSTIHFSSLFDAEQKDGKILYKITSRNAKNSLKIKTPFAIIGIKGTTFIVNATQKKSSVTLKEGLIGVTSLKKEFEFYKQKLKKEFDAYKSKETDEFDAYKKSRNEFNSKTQRVKRFDLHAGNKISFDGNIVNEKTIGSDDMKEFQYFENLLKN